MAELVEVVQLQGEGQAHVPLVITDPVDVTLAHGALGDAPWAPEAMRMEGLNESSYLFLGLWSGEALERWIWLASAPEPPAEIVEVDDLTPPRLPKSTWVHRQGDELPWTVSAGQWRLTLATNIPNMAVAATMAILPSSIGLDAEGVSKRVWWESAHALDGVEEKWEWQWEVTVDDRALALGNFFVWGPAASAGQRDLSRIIPYFEQDGEIREEPFPSPGSTFAGGGRGHFFGTGPIVLDAGTWTGRAAYSQTSTTPPGEVMAGIGSLVVPVQHDFDP